MQGSHLSLVQFLDENKVLTQIWNTHAYFFMLYKPIIPVIVGVLIHYCLPTLDWLVLSMTDEKTKGSCSVLAPNNQLLLCLLNISVVLDANETFWSTFFGFLSNYIFQDGLIWFIKG